MRQNPLIGKKLLKVFLSEDKETIKFEVEENYPIYAVTDADCCSSTWVEDIESPSHVLGGIVTAVEDLELDQDPVEDDEYEHLQFYGTKIVTDKGSFVIDYRNESNGYYGGSLDFPEFYNLPFDSKPWKEVL
jgi:hypothetical protein